MAQRKHYPKEPDRTIPPWWSFVLTIGSAVAMFTMANSVVGHDIAVDSKHFADEDDVSRRREDAARCIAGRLDQMARVILPSIATPTPTSRANPGITKRPPEHYVPTTATVNVDCDDARLERRRL